MDFLNWNCWLSHDDPIGIELDLWGKKEHLSAYWIMYRWIVHVISLSHCLLL
jgi:hypothetical protein